MSQSISMTPELVYNIVAANPNLRNIVEQTIQLQQMQNQARSMAPMLQQIIQPTPMAQTNNIDWNNFQQPQPMMQQVAQPQQPVAQPIEQQPVAAVPPISQQEQVAQILQQAFGGLQETVETLNKSVLAMSDRLATIEAGAAVQPPKSKVVKAKEVGDN